MHAICSLRILGLLNFTNLTINKLDKSSNVLQVGQIKHSNSFLGACLARCYKLDKSSTVINLTINKLDKSDKSSKVLQDGQIKHSNQFLGACLATCYKLDKSSTVISFLGAYSTCCMYFFLLSMRLSLEKGK